MASERNILLLNCWELGYLWWILGALSWTVFSVWTRIPRVHGGTNTEAWNYRQAVGRCLPVCHSDRSKVRGGEQAGVTCLNALTGKKNCVEPQCDPSVAQAAAVNEELTVLTAHRNRHGRVHKVCLTFRVYTGKCCRSWDVQHWMSLYNINNGSINTRP
jgi:hypothetical protein